MDVMLLSGLLMLICLIIMMLIGVPIAVSLGFSSIVGMLSTLAFEPTVITAAQRVFSGVSVFTLLAIPFFILAGNIMNKGGIALRLIRFAQLLIGRLPGGLAHTNILSNMLFGAVSGSGLAAASAMGSVIGPIEKEEGYDVNFAAATNIASAPTGLLIPPSNVLITYSLISGGTSVAALFMAGYLPGILWGIGCMVVAAIFAKKKGYIGNKRPPFKECMKIVVEAIPSLLLIVVVIGGIIKGVFTATEGACVAVAYSLILSIIYRQISLKDFLRICRESAELTGIIMFLIGTSSIMGWVLSFTGLPEMISKALLGLTTNKFILLLLINIFLLIIGTFMDITPAVLIFTPIFLPVCKSLGMSTLHFGIMITYNLCIGGITPPVGNMLYLGARVAKTTVEKVFKPLAFYYIAIIAVLMLVTYIPAIAEVLPNMMGLMK